MNCLLIFYSEGIVVGEFTSWTGPEITSGEDHITRWLHNLKNLAEYHFKTTVDTVRSTFDNTSYNFETKEFTDDPGV